MALFHSSDCPQDIREAGKEPLDAVGAAAGEFIHQIIEI